MKRYEKIIKQLASEIKDEMQHRISFGYDTMNYEKSYGTAIVVVEVCKRRTSFGLTTFTDVIVAHQDCRKNSPLLTQAITQVVPDWDRLEDDYRQSNYQ